MKIISLLKWSLLILLIASSVGADEIDDLIPYIIQVESGGDVWAYSNKGAIGLMQITEPVIIEYCVENNKRYKVEYTRIGDGTGRIAPNPKRYFMIGQQEDRFASRWTAIYLPEINKIIGEWYLRRLKNHYLKDNYTIERLLAAYNGGITRLRKNNYDISKMPHETRRYVKKVMKLYETN